MQGTLSCLSDGTGSYRERLTLCSLGEDLLVSPFTIDTILSTLVFKQGKRLLWFKKKKKGCLPPLRNTVAYSQQHDENGTSYTCGRGIWLTRFVLSFIAYKSWCQRLPSQTSHSPTPTTHLLHSQFYWSERVA